MIGQVNLLNSIKEQIENDKFPTFSIIVGEKGSGKKTLVHTISELLEVTSVDWCSTAIDSIRGMITDAHITRSYKILYVIPDADTMSIQAKNALLKITEETPNNCYFVMTLEDVNNTLETIRSRGTVFHMDGYSRKEIEDYVDEYYGLTEKEELDIIKDLCETPGQIIELESFGVSEFYDYVKLTVEHIQTVSLANALKMSNRISMKAEDTENYDLKLFWKAFIKVCAGKMVQEREYIHWIRITSKALSKLRVRGINRQMLFDNWVFDIREWR